MGGGCLTIISIRSRLARTVERGAAMAKARSASSSVKNAQHRAFDTCDEPRTKAAFSQTQYLCYLCATYMPPICRRCRNALRTQLGLCATRTVA